MTRAQRFLSSLILLVLVVTLPACHGKKDASPAGAGPLSAGQQNALLWEIRGDSLPGPSYLFGTIHLIGESDFFVSDSVISAFDRSKRVALEIKMDDPAIQAKVMQGVLMTDGSTLQSLLGDGYPAVAQLFKDSLAMDIAVLNLIKPLFVETLAARNMVGEPVRAYEEYFMSRAAETNKELLGLESVEEQIRVFEEIPYDVQAGELLRLAADYRGVRSEFRQLVQLYKSERIHELHHVMRSDSLYNEFEDIFMNRRNQNWLPVIRQMIAVSPTFIAVGAGHLPGEKGMIALLRQSGLRVSPIR